jgi:hypothetical protein
MCAKLVRTTVAIVTPIRCFGINGTSILVSEYSVPIWVRIRAAILADSEGVRTRVATVFHAVTIAIRGNGTARRARTRFGGAAIAFVRNTVNVSVFWAPVLRTRRSRGTAVAIVRDPISVAVRQDWRSGYWLRSAKG